MSVTLETNFTRKALSFQNIFEACEKVVYNSLYIGRFLSHAKEIRKRGSLRNYDCCIILTIYTYLKRNLNSLGNVDMRLSY